MNKKEAVIAAIRHQEAERIPYAVSFTAEGERILRTRYPYDEMQLAIGNFIYQIGAPWWTWYDLPASYSDPDAPDHLPWTRGLGSYDDFFEKCRQIRATTDCYILVTIWGSHFEKANFARGIENFLADLAGHPDFAQSLLDMIIRKNMIMLENIVACPDIDGILLGSDWGSQQALLMSPQIWHEMIAPGELKEYELIKSAGKDVWIHSCGNVEAIIPDLIKMGVDVLNPLQPECMDIARIKAEYGDKLAFWGGISTQRTLPYGTPEDVRAETARVIRLMGKGGGYIASPAQGIQNDVPLANMIALLDELGKFASGEKRIR